MSQPDQAAQARAAISLNFVCRVRDRADAETVRTWLGQVGRTHPARIFAVLPGEEERAPSRIATMLASDVPVVVWWRGQDPLSNDAYGGFAELADRMLLDSNELGLDPSRLSQALAALPRQVHGADLAWTRMTPWRQMLVQALEAHPAGWQDISSLVIVVGRGQDPLNPAAALLAGWMSRQLGWQPIGADGPGRCRLRRADGADVIVRFERAPDSCPTQLQSVRIDDHIDVEHEGSHLRLTVRNKGQIIASMLAGSDSDGQLRGPAATLNEELSMVGGDPVFERALERGLHILAALGAPSA